MDDGEKFADLPPDIQAAIARGMGATPPADPRILECDDPRLIGVVHRDDAVRQKALREENAENGLRALREQPE